MKSAKEWVWSILVLWVAAGIQFGLVPSLSGRYVAPDLLLVAMIVVSTFATRRGGAWVGFLSGVLTGGILGVNMASVTFVRTLAGFSVAALSRSGMDRNSSTIAFVSAGTTLVVQLITLFIAPKPAIGVALLATILSAVVNGALSLPIFALLSRVMDAPGRR